MGIERLTGKRLKVVEEHPFRQTPGGAQTASDTPAQGRGHEPRRGRFGGAGASSGQKPERGPARFGGRGDGTASRPRDGQRSTASAPRFR
jgi:hypothetical protein